MARTESRSSQDRDHQTREEVYTFEEEDALAIPQEVEDRFKNQGMTLRWIRIHIRGVDDYQNVGKRQRDGWVFVTPDEVPELSSTSIVMETGRYAGTVVRGEVALAKMPAGRAKARQEHYENKANELMNAVNSQLMSNNDSRMPIFNTSKSTVTRGKNPKFQD